MNKKIIFIDQDDVIADFYESAKCIHTDEVIKSRMWQPSFFLNLKVIPGSQHAISILEDSGFDVWILTQPLAGHPECYYDKALWIQKHFPQLYKKIIMTQDKGMLIGDYLIDDNKVKWKEKFEKNGGKFIHFNYGGYNKSNKDPEELWKEILEHLTK